MENLEYMKRIKQNMYEKGLEDLQIRCKPFLHTVIDAQYSNNEKVAPYTLISMDFNNLNDINHIEGRQRGDQIIHDALQLYLADLPEGSFCARSGGDEFIIILPCSKPEADTIISQKNALLQQNGKQLSKVSIASQAIASNEGFNLEELMEKAEIVIHEKKQNCCTANLEDGTQESYWKCLDIKLKQNFDTLFKSLRLHDRTLSSKEIKLLYPNLVHAIYHSLQEETIFTPYQHKAYKENPHLDIATKLHTLLTDSTISSEKINSIPTPGYEYVLNTLIKHSNTQHFGKNYLTDYLLKECHLSFLVLLGSVNNVKLSNEVFGFKSTDIEIAKLHHAFEQLVQEHLPASKETFCNTAYIPTARNYLFDLGGGTCVAAVDPTYANTSCLQFDSPIVYTEKGLCQLCLADSPRLMNQYNYKIVLEHMLREADARKDELVLSLLQEKDENSTHLRIGILQKFLAQTSQYYKEHIDEADTPACKKKFCMLAAKQLQTSLHEFNEKQKSFAQPEKALFY